MPEKTSLAAAQKIAEKKNNLFNKFVLLAILALIFILVSIFVASYFVKKSAEEAKVTTGLTRDGITIGWGSLEGTYPNFSLPTQDDSDFNDSLFEALTKVRGNEVLPALATKWTNPSSTVWRFNIRPNVLFQSGDKLTADDVKFSFDQVLQSVGTDNEWSSSSDVGTVKDVKVVDPLTVDIETTKPDPLLVNRITGVYILSKAQVVRDGLAKAVGTGPYVLQSFEQGKKAVVAINEKYWGPLPKVKKATYIVYQTDDDLIAALNKGEIDFARLRSADVKIPNGYLAKEFEDPRVSMLFVNFNDKTIDGKQNPLLNLNARKAVNAALDRKQVIKDASASGKPTGQFLTKSLVGYNNSIGVTQKNVAKVADYLSQAGLPNGFTFSIYTTPDRESIAQAVAKQLSGVNIIAQVKVADNFGDIVGLLQKGEAASFIASPTANDGGELIDGFFKTDSDNNIFGYSNPDVDQLAEQANIDFKPEERKGLLENLVAKIMADQPVIPLYSISETQIMRANFDYSVNYTGDFNLDTISGREVKNPSATSY